MNDQADPRAELPQLQTHYTVYRAYAENAPGWDGENTYADLETAQRYSAHMHAIFAWDADSTGPLTWRHEHGVWDLLDDGQATGIIIVPSRIYAAPDAAPCVGRVHPDFANGEDIRCELPDGHAWHRNGERTWMP